MSGFASVWHPPIRTEVWTRDGRTAMVEVSQSNFGGEVVVVSLELLREMLHDLGFVPQEPQNGPYGSNRGSDDANHTGETQAEMERSNRKGPL